MPHDLTAEELHYTEVTRSGNGIDRSLIVGFENQDDHEDAYFTVDETHIYIYTKSFSTYTCFQGHKNKLLLNAWVSIKMGIKLQTISFL